VAEHENDPFARLATADHDVPAPRLVRLTAADLEAHCRRRLASRALLGLVIVGLGWALADLWSARVEARRRQAARIAALLHEADLLGRDIVACRSELRRGVEAARHEVPMRQAVERGAAAALAGALLGEAAGPRLAQVAADFPGTAAAERARERLHEIESDTKGEERR
jgi:hypothetical protein